MKSEDDNCLSSKEIEEKNQEKDSNLTEYQRHVMRCIRKGQRKPIISIPIGAGK